eukprot:7730551-Alexandrium_andersonii.AAC.1
MPGPIEGVLPSAPARQFPPATVARVLRARPFATRALPSRACSMPPSRVPPGDHWRVSIA